MGDVEVWLCTGDHEVSALSVARDVGIDEDKVCANVSPKGKADLVSRLQKRQNTGQREGLLQNLNERNVVAMVGDGINDAVALANSDIGIAIGAGTEIAMEAADIVLINNSLTDVVIALHLSKKVFSRIQTNLFFALCYNVMAIPFAAGILYPFTSWRLPPAFAGLMMAFSSVRVVTNSLLLRFYNKPIVQNDGSLFHENRWFSKGLSNTTTSIATAAEFELTKSPSTGTFA